MLALEDILFLSAKAALSSLRDGRQSAVAIRPTIRLVGAADGRDVLRRPDRRRHVTPAAARAASPPAQGWLNGSADRTAAPPRIGTVMSPPQPPALPASPLRAG
jgi:hypothetical protein